MTDDAYQKLLDTASKPLLRTAFREALAYRRALRVMGICPDRIAKEAGE
jgi:hypothetical protein